MPRVLKSEIKSAYQDLAGFGLSWAVRRVAAKAIAQHGLVDGLEVLGARQGAYAQQAAAALRPRLTPVLCLCGLPGCMEFQLK